MLGLKINIMFFVVFYLIIIVDSLFITLISKAYTGTPHLTRFSYSLEFHPTPVFSSPKTVLFFYLTRFFFRNPKNAKTIAIKLFQHTFFYLNLMQKGKIFSNQLFISQTKYCIFQITFIFYLKGVQTITLY